VSRLLLGRSVSFTLDTYSAAVPVMEERAAEQIAAFVRSS
jgi:hypothetical protein